jgi:hypothetical protein
MSPQSDDPTQDVSAAIERIRELNEQVLEAGRQVGLGFLDAYEQSLQTFADLQSQAGEGANAGWITELAKAQADFTRHVTRLWADAARQSLQR